jgi:DNA-binding protein Fis
LERTHGNQSAAARLLGISRYALRYRLEKFGLADAPAEPARET